MTLQALSKVRKQSPCGDLGCKASVAHADAPEQVGGITYNGKLATVQAAVGNRFSIKLDAVDRDGNIRKGQGMEIKVAPENMEIFDEEIEAMLDAEVRGLPP